ncbi:MAG: CBS domain-containing protein [Thermoguttaceae bacterium]
MDRINIKRNQLKESLLADTGRGFRVSHAMTVEPSCVLAETSVLELVELFHEKQFRHVLVVDGEGRLSGIVSDRDVLRCFGPQEGPRRSVLASIRVGDLMSTDLVTVGPETLLEEAVTLMVEEGISALPVLHGTELVGILTNTDLHVVLQVFLQSALAESSLGSLRSGGSSPHSQDNRTTDSLA